MRRWIVRLLAGIMRKRHQLAAPSYGATNWDFPFITGTPGLVKRKAHTFNVTKNHRQSGAPDRNRTCNLRFRRPSLYPVELRAHSLDCIAFSPARKRKAREEGRSGDSGLGSIRV